MVWKKNVLRKKAEKFERMKFEDFSLNNERVLALEPLLQEVYASMRPKPDDCEVRRSLVQIFNMIAKDIYGKWKTKNIPVVVEFGSFVMDLFTTSSDLDLSVNFSSTAADFPHEKKIRALRKFASKLYALQREGHVYGVQPIFAAKVPILKCVDRGTGVECDISVENRDGILKSQIIRLITSIDERFQKLSFLMKIWAKSHNINSSREKTLNSLSIILLVAFHLQTRKPPVLPPFSDIFKDGNDPETVEKSVSSFSNYGEKNQESLAHLFITLLIKLSSVEKLWPKGLCVSNCDAAWKRRAWDSKFDCFSVEDFTDEFQNVARAVGQAEVKQIYKCINISIQHISSFLSGELGVEVKELLFGEGFTSGVPRGISNSQPRRLMASKKRKCAAVDGTTPNNKINTLGTKAGRRKQSSSLKAIRVKGMRSSNGRKWISCQSTKFEETQQVDVAWGGIQQPAQASGWEETQEIAGGWKLTQLSNSWAWGGGWKKKCPGWGTGGLKNTTTWVSWESREQSNADRWGVNQDGGWKKSTVWGSWGWSQNNKNDTGVRV